MKKFACGLVCGVALASSSVALASNSIQAFLFPVQFEINGSAVSMSKDDKVLQVDGRAYVPIRFVAENLGATIDYDSSMKKILIKNQKLDLVDPTYKNISVGNLIVTKDGNHSKVTGQIEIAGVGNSQNSIEAKLSFYNAANKKLGEAVIRGTNFGVDAQNFLAQGNGDLREYATVTLQVESVNDKKVLKEPGVLYENKDYHFSLTLPKSWVGKYEVVEARNEATEMTYHFIDRANKNYGGVVFSLSVWKRHDWEASESGEMEVGRTKKIGESGSFVVTLSQPGDVQYDPQNEKLTAEYAQMAASITSISTSFQVSK
ncbi:copper amine oxidase N-terminal domain-containing protein [Brevibacillus choshinensis]|uniref:copper amine oxidase N-terminal domain-containing protein n=1 Tax=Brevibacillus choshinensis TaxID=54911 RepID=UPI002E214A4F|nr:copper amine oxidase N-terminal domain-containing protein [Brevibacillus choshinensis]